jgi:chemotaxis receptor (MCP) glutamine deamidase CheD
VVKEQLLEVSIAPETYEVSGEPVLMTAELHGSLALCLHDESRGIGGMLHRRFIDGSGRPSDVTDNTLNSILEVLDRFKRAVLGTGVDPKDVQARIIAHALPPVHIDEPTANLVDLIRADLADAKITCGTQTIRRPESVKVYFQPFEGRIWVQGPHDLRAPQRASR